MLGAPPDIAAATGSETTSASAAGGRTPWSPRTARAPGALVGASPRSGGPRPRRAGVPRGARRAARPRRRPPRGPPTAPRRRRRRGRARRGASSPRRRRSSRPRRRRRPGAARPRATSTTPRRTPPPRSPPRRRAPPRRRSVTRAPSRSPAHRTTRRGPAEARDPCRTLVAMARRGLRTLAAARVRGPLRPRHGLRAPRACPGGDARGRHARHDLARGLAVLLHLTGRRGGQGPALPAVDRRALRGRLARCSGPRSTRTGGRGASSSSARPPAGSCCASSWRKHQLAVAVPRGVLRAGAVQALPRDARRARPRDGRRRRAAHRRRGRGPRRVAAAVDAPPARPRSRRASRATTPSSPRSARSRAL